MEMTTDQATAEKLISKWYRSTEQVFVLAGFAGTGKTTLLKHVVEDKLGLDPETNVAFITPTGKAATVLIKNGIAATTLHRLIYQSIMVEEEVEIGGKVKKIEKLKFKRRESIDKRIKLIVLDEASMVSDYVMFDLLNFGVKMILCGDNAQLPPVEGFNSWLKSPNYTLEKIVRQQLDNPIIMLSNLAREGKYIPYGRYGNNVSVIDKRTFLGERRKSLVRASQIICGTNKMRTEINSEVRGYLSNKGLPQSGEKLICTSNNWESFLDEDCRFNMVNGIIGYAFKPEYDLDKFIGTAVFKPEFLQSPCPEPVNFDIGIFIGDDYHYRRDDYFEKFDDDGESVGVFTLNRFEYGYCISCHKAQGSEFDNLVVFDESYCFKEDKSRWLYTAITRAKQKLIVIR